MIHPPRIRGGTASRTVSLVTGLFLFALGIVFLLESDLGLDPWDVLNQGVSEKTGLSFGTVNIVISLVVLAVAWALGATIGIGTLANAVLIGLFVDLLLRVDTIAALSERSLGARAVLLVLGIAIIALGSGLYIGADFGAGPRDSLMLVGARRTGVRIGIVRATIEVSAAGVGFALGGTVGIGTVAFAFGIGPAVELAFGALLGLGLAAQGLRAQVPDTCEYDRAS